MAVLLLLMSAVGIAVSAHADREKQISDAKQKRSALQAFAYNAAEIALARLQEIAGTDAVVTSAHPHSANGFPHLAWNVANPPPHFPEKISPETPVPLSSVTGQTADAEHAEFPRKSNDGKALSAPWEYVGEQLRFAYLIIDESQKFPLVPPKRPTPQSKTGKEDEATRQARNQLLNFNYIGKNDNRRDDSDEKHSEVIRSAQYDPAWFFTKHGRQKKISPADTTLHTFGVIADWPRKRLKKDLSDENNSDEIFPPSLLKNLREALPEFPHAGLPVSRSVPPEIGQLGIRFGIVPVPVDLKLHVGFINARTDGQHRVRFHITAKLWNPNTFPMLAHADGQLGLIDFLQLPTFFIQNLDTGGKFSVDFSNFPTGRFGLVRQTPSDKTFNAYCKIFDASDQGFGDDPKSPVAGLHAGEIYLARFPDPRGQSSGLSRICGGPTWKFQKNSDPNKAPYKTNDGRWFHDLHRINIFSMPSMLPESIVIRHYNGSFPQSTEPKDYSAPIVTLKNFRFPYVDFTISGQTYNREKAGDYTIQQANLVFRIRLKYEDAKAMKNLLDHCDLRNGVLDFENPYVANAFEVSAHTGEEARRLSEEEQDGNYFFDRFVNEHRTENPRPAFSEIRLYDLPNRKHASAGTLRFLQANKIPPLAVGRHSETVKTQKINQILDRYFFSLQFSNEFSTTSENPLFVHKDQMLSLQALEKSKDFNFAEQCMIRGPFNLNSTDEKAWEALLSNTFRQWKQYSGRDRRRIMPWDRNSTPEDWENVYFTQPFSAHIFSSCGKIYPLKDSDLEKAPRRSREHFLLAQGLRSLTPESVASLANYLAKTIKQRLSEREPFLSLSDFADSGILENGIESAQINTIDDNKIPAWFPAFLKQEHLLETLALRASPRGDSFTLLLRSEQINPLTRQTEAVVNLEARIQRLPDLFDSSQSAGIEYESANGKNRRFGRRFRILSFKFL